MSEQREIGDPVRVSDTQDRYHGTRGFIVAHLRPPGGPYRVRAWHAQDYGEPVALDAAAPWECLFYPDQLRKDTRRP